MIKELEDKTVEGGSVVGFVCEAIAADYQPEIVWVFGRYVYRGCIDDSRFCVQSEEFQLETAKRTWSMFIVEMEQESFIELVTCYVESIIDIIIIMHNYGNSPHTILWRFGDITSCSGVH